MASKCACNEPFTVEHALSCPKGAFPIHCHNEIRDITHSLLSEVCQETIVEPVLQPLDGHNLRYASAITDDNARSDIMAKGFLGTSHQNAFFNVTLTRHPTRGSLSLLAMHTMSRSSGACMNKGSRTSS